MRVRPVVHPYDGLTAEIIDHVRRENSKPLPVLNVPGARSHGISLEPHVHKSTLSVCPVNETGRTVYYIASAEVIRSKIIPETGKLRLGRVPGHSPGLPDCTPGFLPDNHSELPP